jgi:hypothetical protein
MTTKAGPENVAGWFLPAKNLAIDPASRDGYFPAASNSFTFPITLKASAT